MTQLKIKELGRQGDGIAEGPVFVPRTLPGELIDGDVIEGRVENAKIIEPSADRIKPVCRHFKTCGGCLMQHASDAVLADWKQNIVADVFASQGLTPQFRTIEVSPPKSRRRAKYTARRTKNGAMAGFYARRSDVLVDVIDCPLVVPMLDGAPDLARDLAKVGTSRKGEISVQCTATRDGMDVAVTGGKPFDQSLTQDLPKLAAQHNVVRLIWNGELVAQSAQPVHRLGQAEMPLPQGAFLQATDHGEQILQARVAEAVGGASHIVDLFSGCGTFALYLANTAPVLSVESDKAMTRACQEAANHAGLIHPVKAISRDLFDNPLTPQDLSKYDAVVLDPPRAGALAQVKELAASNIPVIAYVSCDPTTFTRDAKILTDAGYVFDWVQVVDQFRWSAHVELVGRFIRSEYKKISSQRTAA
ncbi:MAG: class I SAM-dependent RNA methyltransferase [Paracoccaceae bacterium]